MKVVMQVQTRWLGKRVSPGQEMDVDDAVAERWISKGIAAEPPAQAKEKKVLVDTDDPDRLPSDFPGWSALRKVGITHREQLLELSKHELMEINGIGERRAEEIQDLLK